MYEPHASARRTGTPASPSNGLEESLVLAACPSAARCSRWLVRVELPRWGLTHLAPTIETLAGDLVDQIVQTIGPIEPPAAWTDNQDVPMIRCVLWSDSGLAGLRVWDPTHYVIPSVASASLYPSVQWGHSRTDPRGKWSWFQVPITVGQPDPTAPHTIPIPRVETGAQPVAHNTGGFQRVQPRQQAAFEPRNDRYYGVQLSTS
jgi:hypothetical protein